MTRRRLVVALTGVLVLALLSGLLLWQRTPSRGTKPPPPAAPRADSLIVVGVAGLRWSDVNQRDMPTVTKLLRRGAAGTLSVRSAPSVTCPAEGWLTLGAGTYAAIVDPDDIDAEAGCSPRSVPPVALEGPQVPTMPDIVELNDSLRFDAKPGLLGDTMACTAAVGPGAALAAADSAGYLDVYAPTLPENPERMLGRCPFTAIDGGAILGEDTMRRDEVRALDDLVARVEKSRPNGSVLAIVGISETESTQARLHTMVVNGPGFTSGWLRSPSTRRVPYTQLVDVAPTAMSLAGMELPSHVAGRPLSGQASGRPDSVLDTIKILTDTDTQAVMQRSVLGLFWAGFGVFALFVVAGYLWAWRRSRDRQTAVPALRWFSVGMLTLAAVPTATFIANLVPWWRSHSPALAVTGMVAIAAGAMVLLALASASFARGWQLRIGVRLGVLSALTLVVFCWDTSTGAWLQLNSMLGYNPLVAGRFVGFGNIAFSVFAVAAVLLATFVAYGHSRWMSLALLLTVALPVLAVDASPQWGADFGGVLTLVPTFVVLGLLVTRVKVTWRKLALAFGAGFVLVLAISWVDYLRPESSRSHFGRFIASIMDGTAWRIVQRKLLVNIDLLFMGPHTVIAALALAAGIVLLLRPTATLRDVYTTWPAMRVAMTSIAVLAVFGFATNDSGLALPLVMSLIVIPALLSVLAWRRVGDPWHCAPAMNKPQTPTTP